MLPFIMTVAVGVAGEEVAHICVNPLHIQIAHIQDGTGSMSDETAAMTDIMSKTLLQIKERFIGDLDYALAAFTDKPQVITGSGQNPGVWKDFSRYRPDYCYKLKQGMESVETVTPPVIVSGGGKDDHENQYDALAVGAMDPNMGWLPGEKDEKDQQLVRVAVLVTDAGGHRNSPDVDLSPSKRNWFFEELFVGPCNYTDRETCDEKFGFAASRTGQVLSLKGAIEHYQRFYLDTEAEEITKAEYLQWEHEQEVKEFRYCCTKYKGVWPSIYYSSCNKYSSAEICAGVSCKYCSVDGCDELCKNHKDQTEPWLDDLIIPEDYTKNITPYQYGSDRFDANNNPKDCKFMEYPDPFSAEYAQIFKDAGVLPVFFIRQAGTVLKVNEGSWPFNNVTNLYQNHTCPIAGRRLAQFWLCDRDKTRQRSGGISQNGGCDNYDPAMLKPDTFYKDCYDEHYGEVVQALKGHGVEAYYILLDGDVKGQELVERLAAYIQTVIHESSKCIKPTDEPPTDPTTEPTDPTTSPSTDEPTTTAVGPAPRTSTKFHPTDHSDGTDTTAEGSNNVIIISAAAGAGVLAAGGLLAAKLMFPYWGTSPVEPPIIEEANIPDDYQEREQIQHLMTNMYL